MSDRGLRLELPAPDLDALAGAADRLEAWAAEAALADGARRNLLLAFDELASNVVKYARGATLLAVRVRPARSGGALLVLEDDGEPFDPWSLADPDTTRPLEERLPGGLGLHLVKRLARSVSFRHVDGRNRVEVEIAPVERGREDAANAC
jgi:serine/threonine-protein kinase RsbW